jgi:NAD(P)-dependent dehydrogenase (short-subunit alcohol dehydrogenase family)
MRGLKDKIAIIAGAAPGNIGGATATRLAEEGAAVVVADLNEAAARSLADEIRALGGRAVARGLDITDEASYKNLVDFTVKEFGRLDGLFNVAADLSANTIGRDSDVISVPIEVWRRTIDVTLTGYMYGIRHALPVMIQRGSGAIVNTMSSMVWMGEDRRVAYQAAKAALYGLTRHTATLGGKHGVRCNSLAPGVILNSAALMATTEEYCAGMRACRRRYRL